MSLSKSMSCLLKKFVFELNLEEIKNLEIDQMFDRQLIRNKTNLKNHRKDYDLLHMRIQKRRKKLKDLNKAICGYFSSLGKITRTSS